MGRVQGQVAVVTGAAKGLGRAIAQRLAEEGAKVALGDIDAAELERAADAIAASGAEVITAVGDVTDEGPAAALIAAAVERFGRLDILVNNAGVYEFVPLEDVTEEHFHKHFDLNVLGLILASKVAVKHFTSGGSIVNISSVASTVTPPNSVVYSATKAAVDAVTKALSKELGPRNIRVNAINPGVIETEGVNAAGLMESDLVKQIHAQAPLGRVGQPSDVAPAAVFLASDDAAYITGDTLLVTGGVR
jgi:3-oxoacyl-[acyl-carrier protein] reductase